MHHHRRAVLSPAARTRRRSDAKQPPPRRGQGRDRPILPVPAGPRPNRIPSSARPTRSRLGVRLPAYRLDDDRTTVQRGREGAPAPPDGRTRARQAAEVIEEDGAETHIVDRRDLGRIDQGISRHRLRLTRDASSRGVLQARESSSGSRGSSGAFVGLRLTKAPLEVLSAIRTVLALRPYGAASNVGGQLPVVIRGSTRQRRVEN